MLYLLTIALGICFVLLFILYKKDILEPSILFTASFLMLSMMALVNSNRFKLGLHFNTFCVVLGGVLIFIITSFLIKIIYNRKKSKKDLENKKIEFTMINPNKIMQILFMVFAFAACFLYVFFTMKAVNIKFTGISSVMSAISKYDSISKFSDNYSSIKLPFLISNLRVGVIAVGYWFFYVMIHNFVFFKKISVLEIITVIPCFAISLLEGSRTPAFYMISTSIIVFLILLSKYRGFGKIISTKLVLSIIIIGFLFVLSFKPAAKLLGRNINISFSNYISIYCGAQLKNLDIYLNTKHKNTNTIPGSQTFVSLISSYGNKIGFKNYKNYHLDLPFQKVGNVSLGNVYTTFYPYIYDFGYIGLVILVMIMAIISQLLYEVIKNKVLGKYPINTIILYGYVGTSLLLSFFSNKFYENMFSLVIIKYVIVWLLCDFIFIKIFSYKRSGSNGKKQC